MINLFAPKPPQTEAIGRIKEWVYELFELPEENTITVMELRCQEDDCPDVETVIGVFGEPGKALKHKVMKPLSEVTREDVVALAALGTHSCTGHQAV